MRLRFEPNTIRSAIRFLGYWCFRILLQDFGGDLNVNRPSSLTIRGYGSLGDDRGFYRSFLKDHKAAKVGRNDLCACGGGKKHKECHGSVAKNEARDPMVYFLQETGYNGYRAATFLAI